jgi:MFS family permease
LDWVGSIFCGAALVALVMGLTRLPQAVGGVLILVGGIGLSLFVWWELRVEHPVLSMDLFVGNRVFALSSLAAFINYMATSAVTFFLSLYLQYIKVLTPQQAGLVLVAQPVVMAVLSPVMGSLSDRVEPRILASVGMATSAVGLLLLVFLGPSTALIFIVLILLLLGLGFALFSSPNMNAIMGAASREAYGVASAILGTMRLTGQMMSMGVALLILTLVVGKVEVSAENATSFLTATRIAFVVFGILSVGGILASLARGNLRPDGNEVGVRKQTDGQGEDEL